VPRKMGTTFGLLHIDAAGAGLCLLASLAFYAVTVQPVLERHSVLARQRREFEALTQQAAELNVGQAAAQDRLRAVQSERAASTLTLDSAAHINKRVAGLAAFFSDCELEVDDVQTGQVYEGLRCDVVPITIVGRGPYKQHAKFLHGFCSTFGDMSVVKMELIGNPAQASGSEKFRFELLWYAASDKQILAVSPGTARNEVMGVH